MLTGLKEFLENFVKKYNHPAFIKDDPISIPHRFTKLQDLEIIGFWIAMLSWGQRKTILSKGEELIQLMEKDPYDFVLNHEEKDRARFADFKHRTFNYTDTLYFLTFFQAYYRENTSLESAFSQFLPPHAPSVEPALRGFHTLFFSLEDATRRTRKHVSTPERK